METETMPTTDADDDLSLAFAALADPTRRQLLSRLAHGDATVNELAEPFDLSQQAISKHLQVLERAHLISRRRSGRTRPCRLEPDRLNDAVAWIEHHRRLWNDRYDRLDHHLDALRGATRKDPHP
jgi:DNA-binding transcriptional ArsR family regulator